MRVVLLCALSVTIIAAQTTAGQAPAQAPARDRPVRARTPDAPAPKAAGGIIRGIVIGDAGHPLSKARVELTRETRTTEWMFTDSTGSFEFADLTPGSYTLLADKTGFAQAIYGARNLHDAPWAIELAEGGHESVVIRMSKGAVIAGRIVDDLGEPAVGARVMVNTILAEGDQRRLESVSHMPADTDDSGAFRIGGLHAGSYLLSVIALDRMRTITTESVNLTSARPNQRIGRGRTFYPASATSAGAVPIDLRTGEERLDVDITLTPYRPATLTVAVSSKPDPTVKPPPQINLAFAARDDPDSDARGPVGTGFSGLNPNRPTTVDIDPGGWTLFARSGSDGAIAHATLAPGEAQSASLLIRPASRFSGQVTFEGSTRPPSPSAVYIDAIGAGPDSGVPPMLLAPGGPFAVKADGAFSITGVLGTVEFVVSAPAGWTVRRFTAGDRDLLGTRMTFEGSETVSNVRIVLTDDAAEIAGSVVGADTHAAPGCSVAVFPTDASGGFNRYRLQLAQPDRVGKFVIRDVPAGSYTVAAARDLDAAQWTVPESLDRLRQRGTTLTLAEREKKTLTLHCGGTP